VDLLVNPARILGAVVADHQHHVGTSRVQQARPAVDDPVGVAVDRAFNDRDGGHQRLGDTVDALASELHGHLRHEERDALPLLDRSLTPTQWQAFSNDQRRRLGFDGAAQLFPWLLQEASPQQVTAILAGLPPPLREHVLRRHTANHQ
jgi:hypothetical protein